jgi:hypothetical protein
MSPLALRAQKYLALRRSLGHKLEEHERRLLSLVEHLEQTGNTTVTIEAALAWAQRPDCGLDSSVPPRRMSIARGFARFMSGIDPATEVPPAGLLLQHRQRRIPYLYSLADIQALMSAAGGIPTPLRAATYRTLIGLLAVTGMRVGEAIRLSRADIDWEDGVLLIRVPDRPAGVRVDEPQLRRSHARHRQLRSMPGQRPESQADAADHRHPEAAAQLAARTRRPTERPAAASRTSTPPAPTTAAANPIAPGGCVRRKVERCALRAAGARDARRQVRGDDGRGRAQRCRSSATSPSAARSCRTSRARSHPLRSASLTPAPSVAACCASPSTRRRRRRRRDASWRSSSASCSSRSPSPCRWPLAAGRWPL